MPSFPPPICAAAACRSLRQVRGYATAVEACHAALALLRHFVTASGRPPLLVFDVDDTLVDDSSAVNEPVLALLQAAVRQLRATVYLVTAREASPQARAETEAELRQAGVPMDACAGLFLAPPASRISMTAVSKWKAATRQALATSEGRAVALSVGDQWGDFVQLRSDKDIDTLDAAVPSPFAITSVAAAATPTLFGLKLRARD